MLVPVPKAGGRPGSRVSGGSGGPTVSSTPVSPLGAPALRDGELIAWCQELIRMVFGE
jgi:hypothetical protein